MRGVSDYCHIESELKVIKIRGHGDNPKKPEEKIEFIKYVAMK